MSRGLRAVLRVVPILTVGGLIDMAIAAARGRDLGASTGIVIGTLLFGATGWFVTRDRDKPR